MNRQTMCVQCGIQIDIEQYAAHLDRCIAQKEVNPDDSDLKQCPLCNQMVTHLLQHCQTCMIDNDNENDEPLGATSVPQVYENVLSVPGNLSIFVA
jgi:hypothetical protein